MGQRSSPSVEIIFTDCEVPAENRLGEEGQGLKIALGALDGGRIGIAAQAVGIAQGALEASVKYAKQRRAFGKTIGEFQAIQWMLADMQTEIEAARALVYQPPVRDKDSGAHDGPCRLARKTLRRRNGQSRRLQSRADSRQPGYSRESDVERMYRDARVITIYEGTSEIQRMIIARDLLK